MHHLNTKRFGGIEIIGSGVNFYVRNHHGGAIIVVNSTAMTTNLSGTTIVDTIVHTGVGNATFCDNLTIVSSDDETAQMCFDLSSISTGSKRTIFMPDSDVDLGLVGGGFFYL